MSRFARVLEQAERERALQAEASRQQENAVAPPAPPSVVLSPSPIPPGPPAMTNGGALPARRLEPSFAPTGVDEHLVSLLHPTSFQAERYRVLRHLVEQLHRGSELSVVAVASAGIGDGKTTTAINLAGSLAQAPGSRVLLVDADLRKSSIRQYLALGESDSPGLVEAILDPQLGLDDVVISRPPFNLDVLPAGILPSAPYEILGSPRLGELLEEARRRYDFVVLDTAPLVPVPDSRLLGKWVDGFLLVVAAHRTPRKLLAEALNQMEPAKLVGLVFNGEDESQPEHYYYYQRHVKPLDDDRPYGGRSSWWRALWRRRGGWARTTRPTRGQAHV
jgi:capsular exopolysaccharide synthesis family protein